MIHRLENTHPLAPTSSAVAINRFNAILPVTIAVLGKLDHERYRLRIGAKEMTTKSHRPLENGALYWGEFREGLHGVVQLSGLQKKPSTLQKAPPFAFTPEEFDRVFGAATPLEAFHALLVEKLTATEQPIAFARYATLLGLVRKGLIHFPMQLGSRIVLFQVHYEEQKILFYAGFEHLGPLKGTIGTALPVTLATPFQSSYAFLDSRKEELGTGALKLLLDTTVAPLAAGETLLDLHG